VTETLVREAIQWRPHITVDKREEDINAHLAKALGIKIAGVEQMFRDRALWTPTDERRVTEAQRDFFARTKPFEVLERDGNALVNAGINLLWNLVCAAGGTAFNNANAHLGVGDSSTATTAGMTDLQAATNKLRKAMNGGFPTSGTNQKATWQASFSGAEANYAWNEWAMFNASSAGTMLNRKVESLGTKAAGTWTLTVDVSLS
jgi:hypothetical protein